MNAPETISTAPASPWLAIHPGLGISMMDHLFNRLDGAYPHRWRSAFANQQAINNWRESWVEAFEDEGITPHQIKAGLKRCRSMFDWPPSISEFIKACRPAVDPTVAYYKALEQGARRAKGERGDWPSPAVYWAWVKIGAFDFNNVPYTVLKPRWIAALEEECAKGSWPEIPDAHLAIPAPGKNETSREEAKQQLEKLGAVNTWKRPEVGNRDWAHRLLERAKTDSSVPHAAIKIAQEAIAA